MNILQKEVTIYKNLLIHLTVRKQDLRLLLPRIPAPGFAHFHLIKVGVSAWPAWIHTGQRYHIWGKIHSRRGAMIPTIGNQCTSPNTALVVLCVDQALQDQTSWEIEKDLRVNVRNIQEHMSSSWEEDCRV